MQSCDIQSFSDRRDCQYRSVKFGTFAQVGTRSHVKDFCDVLVLNIDLVGPGDLDGHPASWHLYVLSCGWDRFRACLQNRQGW